MKTFTSHRFRQGNTPLLISFPHNGSHIPNDVAQTMTDAGRTSQDTDWFLDRLYDFPELTNASLIIAEQSRYVIDLNRPQTDESLYPGQTTTGLIPLTRFDGQSIYAAEPDEAEVSKRVEQIWKPYHRQIESELDRLTEKFGIAVLVEAHSIEPILPRLFDGRLDDFNIGTNKGKSCDEELCEAVMSALNQQSQYSHVLNGRFVGGFITRHFGKPAENRHAIQFELSQSTYMDDQEKTWDAGKAKQVQPVFQSIISGINQWLKTKQN